MTIRDEIIGMLEEAVYIPAEVSEASNLYTDLGFDSLDFVSFLVCIEEAYAIMFDLAEIELCIHADNLIALVESKVRLRDRDA